MTAKELRQLKKKFDKLCYADKLTFWDTQPGFDYSTGNTRFIDDVPDSERNKPENHLSISPANSEETKLYNDWLLNHFQQKPLNNFDSCKKKYFETIQKSANAIEYTEYEIAQIVKRLEQNQKIHFSLHGYTWGYQSAVLNKFSHLEKSYNDFYKNAFSYAKGIADAYYKGFLLKQLDQLKQGKNILPNTQQTNAIVGSNTTSENVVEKTNFENRHVVIERLFIVQYFEGEKIKVELFQTGNKHFKEQGTIDLYDIREAEKDNLKIKEGWRTRDLLHLDSVREADINDLKELLNEKFEEGKLHKGYKTLSTFAKDELKDKEWQWSKYIDWFPILKQWFEFLNQIAAKDNSSASYHVGRKSPVKESKVKSAVPKTFKDVFAVSDWRKYISALEKTEPPLLNGMEFIGNHKKHKGVICAWFKSLQYKGIIKQNVNRSQLAHVLNNELNNFHLGIDGKSFDNVSKEFDNKFKNQLEDKVK